MLLKKEVYKVFTCTSKFYKISKLLLLKLLLLNFSRFQLLAEPSWKLSLT